MKRLAGFVSLISVATSLMPAMSFAGARAGTIDWLALDPGQAIDCPARVAGVETTGRSDCFSTGMTDTVFRKHLKQRLRVAARDGHMRSDGWRYLEDGMSRRLLVHGAYCDLVYAVDGTIAIIPQSCLGAGSDLHSADDLKVPPRAIERVPPEYPKEARVERAEGFAVVEGVIGADGSVTEACIVAERPEGVGFGRASLEALRQTRFDPARIDGAAVPARLTLSHTYYFGSH